jgi:hypothetical protein
MSARSSREHAHVGAVARERLEVVRRVAAVVELAREVAVVRRRDARPGLRAEAACVHRALEDLVAPELEPGRIQEPEDPVVAPRRARADLADALRRRRRLERRDQRVADAVALFVRAHADHLEPQRRLLAPELAGEFAGEQVAGEPAGVVHGELPVQIRTRLGGAQPALEVGAARAARELCIDRDHRVEVAPFEATCVRHRNGGHCNRCHGLLPHRPR